MSVLIEGMEIHKDYKYVDVRIFCDGTATTASAEEPFYKKMDVVEVPTHGRLIDADLLGKILKERAEEEWNKNTAPFSWSYAYECLMDTLDIMPTIIEAEEI